MYDTVNSQYLKHWYLKISSLTLNTEFSKYGIWELLRHKNIPETNVLATLLTGNAWLFNGKKIS